MLALICFLSSVDSNVKVDTTKCAQISGFRVLPGGCFQL